MEISNKQKVVALLKSIETGDTAPVSYINPEKYIQHNLAIANGLAGFGALKKHHCRLYDSCRLRCLHFQLYG